MFRKLITNISYSPALIESLSHFALRLRKEEFRRRIGVVFLMFALLIQLGINLFPPEAGNTASPEDTTYGGFSNVSTFLDQYDRDQHHLRDLLTEVGVTRQNIVDAKRQTITSKDALYEIDSIRHFSEADGVRMVQYKTSADYTSLATARAYLTPLKNWDTTSLAKQYGTTYTVLSGTSQTAGWFGINMHNGNVLLKQAPSHLDPQPLCKVSNETKKISDQQQQALCQKTLTQTIHNDTQDADATKVIAQPGDQLTYTFTVTNPLKDAIVLPVAVSLYDTLEYARINNIDHGTLDTTLGIVSWPEINLKAGESHTYTLTASVLRDIPATNQGISTPSSYDCVMTSLLYDSKHVAVACPPVKNIESVTRNLPRLNTTWFAVEVIAVLCIIYLYLRSHLIKEEVRLIRKDINAGNI